MPPLPTSCTSDRTKEALLCALIISLLGSLFIYMAHFHLDMMWLNTMSGILSLYLLLQSNAKVWFWSGFGFGLFWFWWIGLSFIHYHMPWAIPFVILFVGFGYGVIFWSIAALAQKIEAYILKKRSHAQQYFTLSIKAFGLLTLSYLHPFGFDWFKPELMFVESYLGIEKWQFGIILATLLLTIVTKKLWLVLLLLLALDLHHPLLSTQNPLHTTLVTTYTSVEAKWDKTKQPNQFKALFQKIDQAIASGKKLVILPESVFPLFLDSTPALYHALKKRAQKINIVTGALFWDGKTPRNSTYVFTTDGRVTVANKVVLVPFGEANPLPDFLSHWVNRVFYDGAVDYKAAPKPVNYTIDGVTYRNAICFEATSERLYEGNPKQMIVLSNNGWFTPSIEPTLQKLLLTYYSRKYDTTIYHAVNMSPSYIIHRHVLFQYQSK